MKLTNNIYKSTLSLTLIFALISCQKNNDNPSFDPNGRGNLTLHFDNVAGAQLLELNSKWYKTTYGDSIRISKFQYYVSNIKLKKTDGSQYIVPQDSSYFLVQESDPDSHEIVLHNVPFGDYNGATFTIGVDSMRNVADVSNRTGALDISVVDKGGDMYFNSNKGYVFLKLEGISPVAPFNKSYNGNVFIYQIGGFDGKNSINNLKTISLATGSSKAMVRSEIDPEIHLVIDVLKAFGDGTNSTSKIDLANIPIVMWGDYSKNIANNYVSMFQYDHVHNDVKK